MRDVQRIIIASRIHNIDNLNSNLKIKKNYIT